MLIKKADVKNHLAAKLKKRHILQGSTVGQVPAQDPSPGADAVRGSVAEPSKPSSKFTPPVPSSGGH